MKRSIAALFLMVSLGCTSSNLRLDCQHLHAHWQFVRLGNEENLAGGMMRCELHCTHCDQCLEIQPFPKSLTTEW